jgi:hypothetical protein
MMPLHSTRAVLGLAWICAALVLCACGGSPVPAPTPMPAPTPAPAAMYICAQGKGVTLRVDSSCQVSGTMGLADSARLDVARVDGGCAAIRTTDGAQGYVPAQYLCAAPSGVDWSKAKDYVGQVGTVCGPVIGASYGPDVKGRPMSLNVGEDKPSPNGFQVWLWGMYEGHPAEPPENDYLGRWVCVTGLITRVGGVPAMDIADPWAIYVR